MGRYWDLYKYGFDKWSWSRPFVHKNDLLKNTISND